MLRGDGDVQGSHKALCDWIEWRRMGTRGALAGKAEAYLLGDLWTYTMSLSALDMGAIGRV